MRYRKTATVEAFQMTEQRRRVHDEWPDWLKAAYSQQRKTAGSVYPMMDGTLQVHTLEGPLTAQNGDYIIRGIKGELYPCKAELFEATYEAID